jgi:hypothetical protein
LEAYRPCEVCHLLLWDFYEVVKDKITNIGIL